MCIRDRLKIDDSLPVFRGYGKSKNEARRSVCKLAYDYLADKGLLLSLIHIFGARALPYFSPV